MLYMAPGSQSQGQKPVDTLRALSVHEAKEVASPATVDGNSEYIRTLAQAEMNYFKLCLPHPQSFTLALVLTRAISK